MRSILGRTIQERLVKATLIVVLFVSVPAVAIYGAAKEVSVATEDFRRAAELTQVAADLRYTVVRLQSLTLQYVIRPDSAITDEMETVASQRAALLTRLQTETRSATVRQKLQTFADLTPQRAAVREKIVNAVDAGATFTVLDPLIRERQSLDEQSYALIASVLNDERAIRAAAAEALRRAVQVMTWALLVGGPVVLLLMALMVLELVRTIVLPMRRTADEIGSAALRLAASSQQTSAAAQQNVSVSQQISAGAAEQSQQAEAVSRETASMSAAVQQMSGGIQDAAAQAQLASSLAQTAGVRAESVTALAATIGIISEQTNMLALNAAIEAARAGESGRGFTVVADEVRRLAESAAANAKEVRETVTEMLDKVRDAVAASNAVALRITEVSASAQQEASSIQSIAKTMTAISAVAEQTAAGVEQLSASNQQVSSANQEVAAAANQMERSTRDLLTLLYAKVPDLRKPPAQPAPTVRAVAATAPASRRTAARAPVKRESKR